MRGMCPSGGLALGTAVMMNGLRTSSESGEDQRMPDFDVVLRGAGGPRLWGGGALVGAGPPHWAVGPPRWLPQPPRRGETWEHAVARRDEVAGHLHDAAAAAGLAEAGVTLIRGTARITGP